MNEIPMAQFEDRPAPECHHDFLACVISRDETLRLPDEH